MKTLTIVLGICLLVLTACSGGEKAESESDKEVPKDRPKVYLETDMGMITLELFPEVAPNHVRNFLELANKGFYDGLIFHRVVPGFVIQGGCPKGDGTGNAGYTIPAEFSDLKHMPGTLAMARSADPNSASCQFYICLAQLPSLDGNYTIFGQTIDGMDVVQAIGKVETEKQKPLEDVHIVLVWEEGKERQPAETDPAGQTEGQ